MRKFFAVACLLAATTIASAATITINCSPIFAPVAFSPQPSSCPGFGVIPGTVTGLSGRYVFDFTFNQDATPPAPTVTFAVNVPGADSLDASGIVVTQATRPVTHIEPGNPAEAGLLAAPFSVSVSWTAAVPPVTGVTGDLSFTVVYDEPTGGIPEPTTMLLLGGGLLAVAAASRYRRQA